MYVFRTLLLVAVHLWTTSGSIVSLDQHEQDRRLWEEASKCFIKLNFSTAPNGSYCPQTWDMIACWPHTKAGDTWSIPCPDYINGFKTDGKDALSTDIRLTGLENQRGKLLINLGHAYRTCTVNGTWFYNPAVNNTWTDYSQCIPTLKNTPKLIEEHLGSISLMFNIGYGVSLVSLVMATIIMLMFRRLRCQRTTIHVNLFTSFILRATMSFLKENLLVEGVGFPADVIKTDTGGVKFIEEGTHWECKFFFCLFYYFLGANYMWIFVEGLYLHMLVTVAVFSEKSGIKWLVIFGWASTVAFVVPWAIVRATVTTENVYCWNTHPTPGYFWIMRGQIVASVVLNFAIFINIIRVLFTKLNAFNARETKKFRYKKLAKSTLVLIPLFGVHYVVFIGLPDNVSDTALLVKLYFEMGFNSFQGFFVSLIFCFFNGEVQAEIRKKWMRFRLSRGKGLNGRSTRDTMTSFVSRGRGGSLVSNSNSADSKEHPPSNGECIRDVSCDTPLVNEHNCIMQKYKMCTTNGHSKNNNRGESQPMVSFDLSSTTEGL